MYAPVDVNDQLYEKEISLLRRYRNFASEGFLECFDLLHIFKIALLTSRRDFKAI